MATQANKKLDGEQSSHDQRQHASGMNLETYVDFGGAMSGAVLAKRHEAATGRRLADKVVGLLSAEEVKAFEKKEAEAAAGSEKEGVYQF